MEAFHMDLTIVSLAMRKDLANWHIGDDADFKDWSGTIVGPPGVRKSVD